MHNDVLVKIIHQMPTRVIQKINEQNIDIKKIIYNNDEIYLRIPYFEYDKLLKKLGFYEPQIIEYYGFLKIKKVFANYYIIIISLLFAFLIITISSNLIVDISIIHENKNLQELIMSDLYDYGIRKFSFKKSYNELTKIKKNIKNAHLDRIEWLEIRKVGMRYIIDLEERILVDEKSKNRYCHIVASQDGVIKRINVYDGEGIVSFNDYVKKGDILISGDVKLNGEVVSHNCATGDVYAEVWYMVNVKVPLNYYENKTTGKKRNNYIVNYNGIDYKIFKDRLKNYESNKKKIFDLLGIKIYLENEKEIKKVKHIYTQTEALNKGVVLAREKVSLKLKKDDMIIEEKILQNRIIDSTMDIDIFIVVEEDIGQTVEAKEDEINDL